MSGTTDLRPLEEAVRVETDIAARAAAIRGDDFDGLTPKLFLALWPLLKEPIPQGFIQSLGRLTGKPYHSTGIKSVQVQIDRMNNVLTPLGWRETTYYEDDGRLAHVRVEVVGDTGKVLTFRESRGGVNQASTVGNLYKGSYTNAAKLAFARLGPGHEVYVGVTDLDPDVHEQTAEAQRPRTNGAPAPLPASDLPLSDEQRGRVVAAFTEAGVEDMSTFLMAAGVDSTDELTAASALKLRELLDEHKGKAS